MSCRQPKLCDCSRCIIHNAKVRKEIRDRRNLIQDAKNLTMDSSKEYIFELLKQIVSEL